MEDEATTYWNQLRFAGYSTTGALLLVIEKFPDLSEAFLSWLAS